MSLVNTWKEIRDNSFIQNLSRSFRFPVPWRCFFSSVHLTHFLQSSGQRTGMARAEAWFCAQWPIFCVVFEVWVLILFYGWKIQTWPIIRFLTVSHLLIFYLLVFDRIHNAMSLNKMSRTSSKIQQYILFYTWDNLEYLLLKSSFCSFVWQLLLRFS